MSSDEAAQHAYRARLLKVVAYIDANLDADLALDTLASVASFSKFHFQRQFAALFGMSVFEVVHLLRLKRASCDLAYRNHSVIDVAFDAGYESPESFARAFKKRFGQSPTEWRESPDWVGWHAATDRLYQLRRELMEQTKTTEPVTIVDFPETRIAVLEHRGDHRLLGNTIRTFISWRRENRLPPRASATFNLLYGDPDTTPPDEFRMDLCVAIKGPVPTNTFGIAGGRDSCRSLCRAPTSWFRRRSRHNIGPPLPGMAARQRRGTPRLPSVRPARGLFPRGTGARERRRRLSTIEVAVAWRI